MDQLIQNTKPSDREAVECREFGEHIWMKNGDGSEECPCGTAYFPPDNRHYQ